MVAVALVSAVCLGVLGFLGLRQAAGLQRKNTLGARISSEVATLGALEWQARSERRVSVQVTAGVAGARGRVGSAFAQLSTLDSVEADRGLAAYGPYVHASDHELALLLAGDLRAAAAFGRRQVDPRHARLTASIQAQMLTTEAEFHHAVTRAKQLLVGCVTATALLLALLVFQFLVQRRARRVDRRRVEELKMADRMKDDFISTVSHELRTPITSVQGYVEELLDVDGDPLTGQQRDFLTIVHRNAGRLLRLINDLLLSAEVIAGKLSLQTQRVDLVQLARNAVEEARTKAAKKTLQLTFSTSQRNAWVEVDSGRIGQAIDNLLSNALKFTPAGGQVSVVVATEKERAMITVTDTGMGMSPAEVSKLFTPFYRTDGAQVKSIQGTGLGLTITQAIVTAHGGSINVRSEPEAGTSFVIILPLSDPRAEPARTTNRAARATAQPHAQ
jgi:signal transduction histidine kinase